jgi:uncharacterized protein (TIGR02147 family)
MASMIVVFDFSEYKSYLVERLGGQRRRVGLRLAVAKALKCQPTFVSQVLNGRPHFSLEQAEKISRFLEHSEDEREYFFLLIQKERAGTRELKDYYATKIGQLLARRQVLTHRLGKGTALSLEDQAIYYSSWHYSAIHIAVTVPSLRTRDSLAEFFRLRPKKVSDILDHLVSTGLLKYYGGKYTTGQTKIRLGNDSHNILKHHTSWRNQAIDSLDRETPNDLHYSGVISLSSADRAKIKDMILDSLKAQLAISDASTEEELYAYCIDFFDLKK